MTITLFISLFTVGSLVCGIITEAIKKTYQNADREYSANVIALVDAIAVGGLGTTAAYMLMEIPWTVNNIICLLLMMVVIWLGATLGFDKVKQTLEQISQITPKEEKKDA
ncbi:MAG: hypothetical protein IJ058_13490 [Lachnospiraceae bacterium]|nr:hypothetical protein [Lachnospiraceae bacterium]